MTLDEAERILSVCDMSNEERFTPEEREAIVTVMTDYMMGKVDRGKAASILRCEPTQLPAPWRNRT